jgi:hypothetical protein
MAFRKNCEACQLLVQWNKNNQEFQNVDGTPHECPEWQKRMEVFRQRQQSSIDLDKRLDSIEKFLNHNQTLLEEIRLKVTSMLPMDRRYK